MSEYHGQKIAKGTLPTDVPAIPRDYQPKGGANGAALRQRTMEGMKQGQEALDSCPGPVAATIYTHVRMTGNYGIGCPNVQSLDYYSITADEAHKYAWSSFGYCGHTIVYFDAQGHVAAQE